MCIDFFHKLAYYASIADKDLGGDLMHTTNFKACILGGDSAALGEFYQRFTQDSGAALIERKSQSTVMLQSKLCDKLNYEFWMHDLSSRPIYELDQDSLYPGTQLYILLDLTNLTNIEYLRHHIEQIQYRDRGALIVLATKPNEFENLKDGVGLARDYNCVVYFEYDQLQDQSKILFEMLDDILYKRIVVHTLSYPNTLATHFLPARKEIFPDDYVLNIHPHHLASKGNDIPDHEEQLKNIKYTSWSHLYLQPEDLYKCFTKLKLLLNDTRDKNKLTLLDYFVQIRDMEMAEMLIGMGAKWRPQFADRDDLSRLRQASSRYRDKIFRADEAAHERNTRSTAVQLNDLKARLMSFTEVDTFTVSVQCIHNLIQGYNDRSMTAFYKYQLCEAMKEMVYPTQLIAKNDVREALLSKVLSKDHAVFEPIKKIQERLKVYETEASASVVEHLQKIYTASQIFINRMCQFSDISLFDKLPWGAVYISASIFDCVHTLMPHAAIKLTDVHRRDNERGVHCLKIINKLFCKLDSDFPGIEDQVCQLHAAIVGTGCAPSIFFKVKDSSPDNHYPELLYTASLEVKALQLQEQIELYSAAVASQIKPSNFSQMIFLTLLTQPQDAKPDNFMLSVSDGQEVKELVCIDNEQSFSDSIVVDDRYPDEHKPGIKSILFVLENMHDKVDPEFRHLFISLTPETILFNWLASLKVKNEEYLNLEKLGVLSMHELKIRLLPILLKKNQIKQLYKKIQDFQSWLREDEALTLNQFFEKAEPLLYRYYMQARQVYHATGFGEEDVIAASARSYQDPTNAFFYEAIFSPEPGDKTYSFESLFADAEDREALFDALKPYDKTVYASRVEALSQPLVEGFEDLLRCVDLSSFTTSYETQAFLKKFDVYHLRHIHLCNSPYVAIEKNLRLRDIYACFRYMESLTLLDMPQITYEHLEDLGNYLVELKRKLYVIIDNRIRFNLDEMQNLAKLGIRISVMIQNIQFDLYDGGYREIMQRLIENNIYSQLIYEYLIDCGGISIEEIIEGAKEAGDKDTLVEGLIVLKATRDHTKLAVAVLEGSQGVEQNELALDHMHLVEQPKNLTDYIFWAVQENCQVFLAHICRQHDGDSVEQHTSDIDVYHSQDLDAFEVLDIENARYQTLLAVAEMSCGYQFYKLLSEHLRSDTNLHISVDSLITHFEEFLNDVAITAGIRCLREFQQLYKDEYPVVAEDGQTILHCNLREVEKYYVKPIQNHLKILQKSLVDAHKITGIDGFVLERVGLLSDVKKMYQEHILQKATTIKTLHALFFSYETLLAVRSGPKNFCQKLLSERLKIFAESPKSINSICNAHGQGVGHYAVFYGHYELARWFVDDCGLTVTHADETASFATRRHNMWNFSQRDGQLMLSEALQSGDWDKVDYLLMHGALMNIGTSSEDIPYAQCVPEIEEAAAQDKLTHLYIFRLIYQGDQARFERALKAGANPFYTDNSESSLIKLYKHKPKKCTWIIQHLVRYYIAPWLAQTYAHRIQKVYVASSQKDKGTKVESIIRSLQEFLQEYLLGNSYSHSNDSRGGLVGRMLKRSQASDAKRFFQKLIGMGDEYMQNRLEIIDEMLASMAQALTDSDPARFFKVAKELIESSKLKKRFLTQRSRLGSGVLDHVKQFDRITSHDSEVKFHKALGVREHEEERSLRERLESLELDQKSSHEEYSQELKKTQLALRENQITISRQTVEISHLRGELSAQALRYQEDTQSLKQELAARDKRHEVETQDLKAETQLMRQELVLQGGRHEAETQSMRQELAARDKRHEVETQDLKAETQSMRQELVLQGGRHEAETQSMRQELAARDKRHEAETQDLKAETQSMRQELVLQGGRHEAETQSMRQELAARDKRHEAETQDLKAETRALNKQVVEQHTQLMSMMQSLFYRQEYVAGSPELPSQRELRLFQGLPQRAPLAVEAAGEEEAASNEMALLSLRTTEL